MARNCYCKPKNDFNEIDNIDNEPPPEGFNDDYSFNEDDYIDNEPSPEGFNDDRSFNEDDYIDNQPLPEGFNDNRSFNEDDYIDNQPLPEGFNDDRSFNEDDYIDNQPLPEGFNDDLSFNEDDYIDNQPLPEGFNDDRSFNEDDFIDNVSVPDEMNNLSMDNINNEAGPVFGFARFPSLNMRLDFDEWGNIIKSVKLGSPASQSSPKHGQTRPMYQGSTPHRPRNDGTQRPLPQEPELGTGARRKLFVGSDSSPHNGPRQGDSIRSPTRRSNLDPETGQNQIMPHSGGPLKGNDGSPKSGTPLGNASGSLSVGSVQSSTEAGRKPKSPCSLGLRPCSAATPKASSRSPRSNTPMEFGRVVPRTPVKIDPNVARISQEAQTRSPPQSFTHSLGSRLGGATVYPNSLQPQKQSPSNRQGSSQSPDNRQSTGDTSSQRVTPSAPIQVNRIHYRPAPIPLLPIMSVSQLARDSYDEENGYDQNNDGARIPLAPLMTQSQLERDNTPSNAYLSGSYFQSQSPAGRQVLDTSSGTSVPGNLGSRQQSLRSPILSVPGTPQPPAYSSPSRAPGTSQPQSPTRVPPASPQLIDDRSRRPTRPIPLSTWSKDDPNNWFTEADYAPNKSLPHYNAPNSLGSFQPVRSSSPDDRDGSGSDSSTDDILELSLIPHDSF